MGMQTEWGLPLTAARQEANSDRRKAPASGVVRTMRFLGAALVAIAASSGGAARADEALSCEREMTRAAAAHGVPLNVLYSVGLTETGSRNGLSPYDMNVDGQAVHSTSLAEAMARFEQAKGRGAKFIDIGCMQINHHFHSADFHSLSEMFDPARKRRIRRELSKIAQ